MGFLSVVLVFTGYTLIYASVAGPPGHGGRFALQPWAGIVGDAYE